MAVTESGFSNSVALCVDGVDLAFPATIDFKFLFLHRTYGMNKTNFGMPE